MNKNIEKLIDNRENLTEILKKDTKQEVIDFCKSKGCEITEKDVDDIFNSQINILLAIKDKKIKLEDEEFMKSVVGGSSFSDEFKNQIFELISSILEMAFTGMGKIIKNLIMKKLFPNSKAKSLNLLSDYGAKNAITIHVNYPNE